MRKSWSDLVQNFLTYTYASIYGISYNIHKHLWNVLFYHTGSQYSDINGALMKAMEVSKKVKSQISLTENAKQMIFFMTDGHATAGATTSIVKLTLPNLN